MIKIFAAIALLVASTTASAAEFVFQWDYTSPQSLHGITYQDGVQVQDVYLGSEYDSTYGLWQSKTISSDFTVGFNIENSAGSLIHTYSAQGTTGAPSFAISFLSAENGPLTALAGGATVLANGQFQTVYDFDAQGDHYTLRFRTGLGAGAVPEPATWALMIGGFAMTGVAMRRRKTLLAA